MSHAEYVELHCHSNFSLLDGASHPEDLVTRATDLNMSGLAITDHNGLYGAVCFYKACQAAGIKAIIGAEITLEGSHHLTLLARNNSGYSNLCRLITAAQLNNRKGSAAVDIATLAKYSDGIFCLSGCRRGQISSLILSGKVERAYEVATMYLRIFGKDNFWIEIQNNLYPEDIHLCRSLVDLARGIRAGYVATNNVHYAKNTGYKSHDVLTCIGNRTTLDECQSLRLNSEFYLKSADEMAELFRDYPEAISNALSLAQECDVTLDFSAYRLPDFPLPNGEVADSYLGRLCLDRATATYAKITPEVARRLNYELRLIRQHDLAGYFLIVWDIMEYARRLGIPAQGRGSAANSIVAYVLGITKVDPIRNRLFVGRFLNEEMSSLPDIDIDISTNHREKLIQYVYEKYGQEHTAMVATYVTFQARNAIREVGKVLGLPAHILDRMAKSVAAYGVDDLEEDLLKLKEFQSYLRSDLWQEFTSLCREIAGFPRHLSIHVGGMLISSCPLVDIVPLERATMPGRIVCQWDKDSVADAGLIKVDLLGLRMLSLIDEACEMVEVTSGRKLDIDHLPLDNQEVYDMICRSDTVGVFQVESRAQMQTLPQTKPRSIEDLTVEVAIIRPGPLQGNMVHPYIRRRKGLQQVTYLHPELEPVLEDTLGVILFQEQVIQVATVIAGFTPGEADALRRAMSRKRSSEAMEQIRQRFVEGAERNQIGVQAANRVFEALKGFAEYGFCKSHAAGFALLCYRSAWLKRYYPAEFYAALLNNQPMGFYTPDVIVHDAQRHGIPILPVDINRSDRRCTVEDGRVRLGFMYVKGLGEKAIRPLLEARQRMPFSSLEDLHHRTKLEKSLIENLIMVGAFDSFGSPKRQSLWELCILEKTGPRQLPLEFAGVRVSLPNLTDLEEMKSEYEVQQLSTKYHPMELLRKDMPQDWVLKSAEVSRLLPGTSVRFAGYVITRQRPATAKGFAFLTLEDEEGMMNVVLKPDVYEAYRQVFRLEPVVLVAGKLQKKDGVANIIAERISPLRQEAETRGLDTAVHTARTLC